uniref:Tuberin n=1 Tax=Timema poppense TaxID=170557 RepID=A0A7R9GW85_TIMPO|nr:unnamed protein product [Timema poppensis]
MTGRSRFESWPGNFKGRENFALTSDVVKDLSPESPLNQRVKIMKEMSEAVLKNHIEESAVEKLWACLKDLFHHDVAKEHRHLAFTFFSCLVQGQYEKLGIMRSHFFRLIKTHDVAEDVAPRFELLQSLTENGKDIKYFEEEVGPFLMQWMPAITGVGKTQQFLAVWVNVIKFNAAYVDEEVIKELVQGPKFHSRNDQRCIIKVLNGVLSIGLFLVYRVSQSNYLQRFYNGQYIKHMFPVLLEQLPACGSDLPASSRYRGVLHQPPIMRNLLGTHLGHSALYTMCRILQDTSSQHDVHLLRGAVFYVNMALWGTKRVTTLKYTATSVLPSFLAVLSSNNSIVMYEVMLSIQRLVNKFGLELKDPAWDLVLSIMEAIIEHIETDSRTSPASQVTSTLHDTICTIEQLMELGQFHGSVRRVFELIERCSPVRPEASVLRLITFLSSNIIPIRSDWIQKLHSLVDKYFKQETRTTIRVRALDVLSNVISLNRPAYEDELIELIVVPQLQHIECDPDILVRNVAAQLLVDLALECENKRCLELLDILEKLLNRPLEQQGDVPITSEQDVADVKTVVVGLINIFTSKLFQLPSSHAIKAYKLLVGHLEAHYLKPAVFELVSSTRYLIFECFLRLRANSLYGLGYPDSVTGQVRFSPYLLVDHKEGERTGGGGSSPPPMSPAPTTYPTCTVTQLSLIQACKLVIACLRQERDWKVLSLILQEVPQVMKNKALILSHHSNEIDLLASALCAMVSDKSLGLPESLQNTPPKFTRSEFHTFVLPVLASLASYHGYLDPGHQQRLIKCLEFGLVSRCSRQCVMALTICALEMKDAMYKLLPEVLLNLSKISATVHIAIPLLEFLSTLTRLPKVFASFVGDQYMSVFAISLPYTNPFKYNHYTVSLAHHVIAVWFLKCRLPFRRDFVKFITTGLKANVIVPFEEGQLIMKSDLINEDSSSRKRSSSLTEQGSRRSLRTVGVRPEGRPGDLKPPIDEALMNFHMRAHRDLY